MKLTSSIISSLVVLLGAVKAVEQCDTSIETVFAYTTQNQDFPAVGTPVTTPTPAIISTATSSSSSSSFAESLSSSTAESSSQSSSSSSASSPAFSSSSPSPSTTTKSTFESITSDVVSSSSSVTTDLETSSAASFSLSSSASAAPLSTTVESTSSETSSTTSSSSESATGVASSTATEESSTTLATSTISTSTHSDTTSEVSSTSSTITTPSSTSFSTSSVDADSTVTTITTIETTKSVNYCGQDNTVSRTTVTTSGNTVETLVTHQFYYHEETCTFDFKDTYLDKHNELRALMEDTNPVTWNDDLAAIAQGYADDYDCSGNLQHSGHNWDGQSIGENLAIGYDFQTAAGVQAWWDEISDYDYNNPGFSSATGHFTQLVWANTNEIGCGFKYCNPVWNYYVVCNYSPIGNILVYGDNPNQLFVQNVHKAKA